MKSIILTTLAALAAALLSSCNTTEGVGEDLQHLGNKIETKANRAR